MKKIWFNGWHCIVQFSEYGNGRTAIELIDAEDGCPVAVATVNIPDAKLAHDEVLIKDWSENHGVMDALMVAGIVGPAIGAVPTGFVVALVCKLLIDPKTSEPWKS